MAEKSKIIMEREYIVPLRRRCAHIPQYRRTPKAVKVLKEFLAKHMKVADRDAKLIKLDRFLNEFFWERGIRKPPIKVRVKAQKNEAGEVYVSLVEMPKFLQFKMDREKKRDSKEVKKEKVEEKKEEVSKEEKEKEEAGKEVEFKESKQQHIEQKHDVQESGVKRKPPAARKVLQR